MIVEFQGKNNETLVGEVIMSETRLKRLAKKLKKVEEYSYDCEFTSLRVQSAGFAELVGISICFGRKDNYYIPVGHFFDEGQLPIETVIKHLKPIWDRTDVRVIGQNIKVDMHILENYGMPLKTKDIYDTMLGSWIIDENLSKGLKAMTNRVYAVPQQSFDGCIATVTKEEKKAYGLKGNQKAPFELVRIPVGAPYALADAYWTWKHYVDWQQDDLVREEMEYIYYNALMPFLLTSYNMERRGVKVDKERLEWMQKEAKKDLEELEYQIVEIAGVELNLGSPQQLAEILFGYMKYNKNKEYVGNEHLVKASFNFPVQGKTATGAPSTGGDILKALSKKTYKKDARKQEGVKMLKLMLKYKKLAKLKSSFMDGILEKIYPDGKVHPCFNVGGTDSGRLSCSEPNFQQLPRPIEFWGNPPKLSDYVPEDIAKKLKEYLEYGDEREVSGINTKPLKGIKYKKYKKKLLKFNEDVGEWRELNKDNLMWKKYEIRSVVIPDDPDNEVMIAQDYANLEMRLLAHFSQDPYLMDTFIHDHDAHGATAVNMFSLDCEADEAKKKYKSLRQIAKTINFLLMYGGSATTLYNTLTDQDAVDENGDPVTKEKAQEYFDAYFDAYSGVADFIKNQKKFAHRHEQVYSIIGRKRRLHNINSSDYRQVGYEERLSVNSSIQGSAGDLMMMAQPEIERHPRLKEIGYRMVMQVHDEIVGVCPKEHAEEAVAIIKEIMEHPLPKELNVPLRLDSDTGASYAEAK